MRLSNPADCGKDWAVANAGKIKLKRQKKIFLIISSQILHQHGS